jgi:glycosyltransferase involved in cell wall biosynthesis
MRLAIISEQLLAPVPGGTGRYTAQLSAALAQHAPAGATVTGWTAWRRDRSAAQIEDVLGPRTLPLGRRALIAAWERRVGPTPRQVDLVHAPTPLAPPRRKRPLVVTVHDAVPWTHPETLTARGVRWHRAMIEHAVREADAIVVPTRAVADELGEVLPLGERAVVVGHGVTETPLPPDADRRAAALGLPERFIAVVGTVEPRKGIDVLIEALSRPVAPDVPVLLAGPAGWGAVDPAAEARRHGVDPARVRSLGRLADEDLAVFLDRATMLTAPSRSEGFGLPVLEAMAAGVPVITSDAPALVEVGGGAAVVVPREDPERLAAALAEVIGDDRLRADLARRGRERAAEFTWKAAAERLWRLYQGLR